MKVLVSAYACNPYLGSEPGVGWTALCRIARRHDVWALVHARHKADWEKARGEGKVPENVTVRFLGENKPWHPNRFIAHLQSWRSFRDYSNQVLAAAKAWHGEIGFDLCHQTTIATWRVPSPLWQLPVPLVWGPIGGAGFIPPGFRSMLSFQARLFERLRDFNTARALRSPALRDCLAHTSTVFAANEETEELLRPFCSQDVLVRLPIASIPPDKVEQFRRPADADTAVGPLRLFAGGNMEGRKGVSLALKALARVKSAGVDFHYTVAGGGPEVPGLRKLAAELGLGDSVVFHPGFRGDEYVKALQNSHVYFLPSFRESTPVTLLEAYLAGCYPVVADTSAQGEIVRRIGGTAVPVDSVEGVVQGLADGVIAASERRGSLHAEVASWSPRLLEMFDSERYDQAIAKAYEAAMSRPDRVPDGAA